MTHQSGAPVTRAAPLKEQLPAAAGEGAQIFSRCRRRGGNTSPLYPPRVCISVWRRRWKIPRLDDARAAKTPARRSRRRKARRDYCRQNSATQKIRNDDVFSSRKVSWFHVIEKNLCRSAFSPLLTAFLQKNASFSPSSYETDASLDGGPGGRGQHMPGGGIGEASVPIVTSQRAEVQICEF